MTFPTPYSRRSTQTGFSLIELLVAATILVLLSTIGLVNYSKATQNARDAKRKVDLETVRQALVLYKTENSTYPATYSESQSSFTSMLNLLDTSGYLKANAVSDPKGQVDPYGYRYAAPAGGASFTLCVELEADGVPSTTDYCVYSP